MFAIKINPTNVAPRRAPAEPFPGLESLRLIHNWEEFAEL
jgi:hypothetical protein